MKQFSSPLVHVASVHVYLTSEESMDHRGVASRRPLPLRVLTDFQLAKRIARFALGLPTPLATPDRVLLEELILPHFLGQADVHRVLFVGVAWYTRHYPQAYFADVDLWTVDADPKARRFGARQHVTGALQSLGNHFKPGRFDLIVCNGVYGHGLNDKEACERAFASCHVLLRPGGYLLLGWNDSPDYPAAPLHTIESLKRFVPFTFAPLDTWRYRTNTPYAHTYDFYSRPAAADDYVERE
jgi:SAM-dependent methyltransferase